MNEDVNTNYNNAYLISINNTNKITYVYKYYCHLQYYKYYINGVYMYR